MSMELSDTSELEAELERISENQTGIFNQISTIHDRLDKLEQTVEQMQQDVSVTKASVPEQSKTKMDNVVGIVQHAYDKDTGGHMGTKLPSGEVTAVIDGSKQTALRLMDEIAGKFSWADVENPGGPNPKELKIKTARDVKKRINGVVEKYEQ